MTDAAVRPSHVPTSDGSSRLPPRNDVTVIRAAVVSLARFRIQNPDAHAAEGSSSPRGRGRTRSTYLSIRTPPLRRGSYWR
jgi:hypothetical protein